MAKFTVVQNVGAGSARILGSGDNKCFHESVVSEHARREEAEAALDALRGEPRWVVFWNNGAARGFVELHHAHSGNWRGSMHGHYNYAGDYATEAEARKALWGMRLWFAVVRQAGRAFAVRRDSLGRLGRNVEIIAQFLTKDEAVELARTENR